MNHDNLSIVEPDLNGLRRNLLRRGTPGRVYYFEHGIAAEVKDPLVRRFGLDDGLTASAGGPVRDWQRVTK